MHDQPATELGRLFRNAWIDAVKRHRPSNPSASSIAPWEQQAAEAVCGLVARLVRSSGGATAKLHAFERGQLLTALWNAHVHQFHPDPPPGYFTPWEDLPAWRRQVNAEVFEAIQGHILYPDV